MLVVGGKDDAFHDIGRDPGWPRVTPTIRADDAKSPDHPTSGCCSNRRLLTFAQSLDPALFFA